MTSPPKSHTIPIEAPTPQAYDAPCEINGLKLKLPRWATYVVATIVTLSAAIPLFTQVLFPMVQEYTAMSKAEKAKADADKAKADAEKAKADAEKAKADEETANSRAQKEKLEQQLAQYKEYQEHFSDVDKSTQKLFDSPKQGSLSVSYYAKDGCLQVMRKGPGHNQAEVSYWIKAKSIPLEAPPGTPDDVRQSRLEATPPQSQPSLNATYGFASFNPISAPPVPERGTVACGNSHTGKFQTWNGQPNGCWVQVWRRWPDGCEHYQWYNTCNGYWDNHPDGSPRVAWKTCIH